MVIIMFPWLSNISLIGTTLSMHVGVYVSSKVPLTDTTAIAAYEKTLRATFIYKYAESFCRVSIT